MDPVVMVFSYPSDRMDDGKSFSIGLMEWKSGRYTSSEWMMMDFSRAISTMSSKVD